MPSLTGWSARGILLKGPHVSHRHVKSTVILAAGWGASLPLAQLAALCNLMTLLLEWRAGWIFSAIRCTSISRSEVAQNARVDVLSLGMRAAGIAQSSDNTDLRSPCHGWAHFLEATSASSQAGRWVNCPTSSSVAAPGPVCIWVIPYLFLAMHPAESPSLLLVSGAKHCQWLITGGVWAHAWL